MKLFGYILDKSVLLERVTPGPLDEPLLHAGGRTGCVVLHGIGGTPANVRVISDALIGAGYSVAAPMLAGHGESLADFENATGGGWLASAEGAFDALRDMGCERIAVAGLSLGGILAGTLAEEREVAAAVLICPPVVMRPYLRFAKSASAVFPYVRYDSKKAQSRPWKPDGYANALSGMATKKLRDLDALSRAFRKNLSKITCPVLTIEAAYDNKVDKKSYDIIRSHAVNAASLSHVRMENSPHGCTYGPEREKIAAETVAFITRSIPQGDA